MLKNDKSGLHFRLEHIYSFIRLSPKPNRIQKMSKLQNINFDFITFYQRNEIEHKLIKATLDEFVLDTLSVNNRKTHTIFTTNRE